jgi:hypothetical protein
MTSVMRGYGSGPGRRSQRRPGPPSFLECGTHILRYTGLRQRGLSVACSRVDELHQRVVDRIREVAEKRQIPVTHLPDRAGVGRSHFWEVMAGRASPTLAWLARIAVALDVDVEELVAASPPSDSDEKPAPPRPRTRRP